MLFKWIYNSFVITSVCGLMNSVKIVRSKRRKKTVQARVVDGTYYVYLPAGLHASEEEKWVTKMVRQLKQREKQNLLNSESQLQNRAASLNKKYFNGSLQFSIQFVGNQRKRFGSCSPFAKTIRISDRIAGMPRWVQDYVILHELTHLRYPDHSKLFWEKVMEYPLCERARGYLIAVGLDDEVTSENL